MSTDQDMPSVRIALDTSTPSAPMPDAPSPLPDRRRPGRVIASAVLVLLLGVGGLTLALDAGPEAQSSDASGRPPWQPERSELTPAVLPLSPAALRPIVADGGGWLTIVDGVLSRSPDLLNWKPDNRVAGPVSVAIAGTEQGPHVLAAQSFFFDGVDLEREVLSVSNSAIANRPPRLGAIDDAGWAAVADVPSLGRFLLVSDDDQRRAYRIGDLEDVTSVAVVGDLALLTAVDDGTTTLHSVNRSLLGPATWCAVRGISRSELLTTGDGAVQLVEAERAWRISAGGTDLELAIDASELSPGKRTSVRPLATGTGWSVTVSEASGPQLFISDDGAGFERLSYPSDVGVPTHVVWANIGAREGVGVAFQTGEGTEIVTRVGDPGARHPSRPEMQRRAQLTPPDRTIAFRGDGVGCAVVDAEELGLD